ncbi:hypothetical protein [Komagataeibacter xylinus]|uniref:DinB/UmuC family translesion DNA polymerase n=1 Tax=Komagataeibacter xylinus TaxID=28448 RepID=UPI00280B4004|nr:hypothetical protein [Komagataeibacter xylinus]
MSGDKDTDFASDSAEGPIDLGMAISHYATTAAEKLRAEGMTASFLTVFIHTNPYQKDTGW